MSDQELAAGWDADRRLAAKVSFVAGVAAIVGAALWLSVGMSVGGELAGEQKPDAFQATLIAGILLLTDVALLVFVVGLAFALTGDRPFGLVLTSAVATLATTVAATLHLVWGHAAAMASIPEAELPAGVVQFVTWLALNLYLMPLFGLLVGATLLALWPALRSSGFRFARRLGVAAGVVGAVLLALSPFTGFGPQQPAYLAVAVIMLAVAGVSVLLLVALVRIGLLLARSRRRSG